MISGSMNTRYLGLGIMALSVVVALVVFSTTSFLLETIDSGHTCSTFGTCPHVLVLNQSYIGYGSSSVIFLIGLFLFVKGDSKRPRIKRGKLGPDEGKLFDMILEAGGMIFQSEIVEKTGFPKARVTRILDKLEAKGILERRRRGMTNAVVLK